MSLRSKIIETAISQLYYKEEPVNKTKFGQWFGLDGVAWCGIFCSWCYNTVKEHLLPAVDFLKGFASVPNLYIRAKKDNWITLQPKLADLVLYDWNGDKAADHVGLFLCWLEEGVSFLAIEGNTSVTNNSNGDGVMIRERYVKSVLTFVRIPGIDQ